MGMHNNKNILDNRLSIIIITIILTSIVGVADIITTSQYRLFFFYFIPIMLSSIYFNVYYSLFLSCFSTFFILVSSYIDYGSLNATHFWNAGMMLVIFISISYMTRSLSTKQMIVKEKLFLEMKNRMLDESLREKEVMIRETHHRIKNNLTTLNSLISLTKAGDSDTLVMKLKNRIQTFIMLYDTLSYSEESISKVKLKEYIAGIIDLIKQNYDIPNDGIEVTIDGGDFYATPKSASLFGLMINKLATNSIRHGFGAIQHQKKMITVKFSIEDNILFMKYCDNGPGFNHDSLESDDRHLGLFLINSLSRQLGGEVQHDGGRSSGFTFMFTDINSMIRVN